MTPPLPEVLPPREEWALIALATHTPRPWPLASLDLHYEWWAPHPDCRYTIKLRLKYTRDLPRDLEALRHRMTVEPIDFEFEVDAK